MKFTSVLVLLAGAQMAFGSLVLSSPNPVSGSGLGTVSTLLTVQSNGAAQTTETGCVGSTSAAIGATFGASGVCTGSSGDVKTGNGQIGPQTLASGGVTSASTFAVVFNADQPAQGPITLTQLTASFYSPTGTFLYSTSGFSCPGLAVSCTFPSTFAGIGNSGFVFVLDAAQQAAATAAGAFSSTSNLVGLSASLANTSGGPETFYLTNVTPAGGGGGQVPEPTTLILTFSGLALVAGGAMRNRSRA